MGSKSCAQMIQAGTEAIQAYKNQRGKLQVMIFCMIEGVLIPQSLFNTCQPIVSEYDWETFVQTIADTYAGFVQYNNDNNGYFPFNVEEV